MLPKAVIFDYNGTLVFDEKVNLEAWKAIALRLGKANDYDVSFSVGINDVKVLQIMLGDEYPLAKLQELSEEKECLYREIADNDPNYKLVEGADSLFNSLKEARIPLILATASILPNVNFYVKKLNLNKWFNSDEIIYDDGNYPDKYSMYKEALTRLACLPSDCVIFEDSIPGLTQARRIAPKKLIALDEKLASPKKSAIADLVIKDFNNITLEDL